MNIAEKYRHEKEQQFTFPNLVLKLKGVTDNQEMTIMLHSSPLHVQVSSIARCRKDQVNQNSNTEGIYYYFL